MHIESNAFFELNKKEEERLFIPSLKKFVKLKCTVCYKITIDDIYNFIGKKQNRNDVMHVTFVNRKSFG